MTTPQTKGVIALIAVTVVFASMGLFARYLQTGFTVIQQVYLRVGMAFFLSSIAFHQKINLSKISKLPLREWGLLWLRAIFTYTAVTLFTLGIISTKYSNVSFIGALPFSAILGVVLFKEKLTPLKTVLVLTAFLGAALIAVSDFDHLLSWGKGEFYTLVASVFFALSYVSRKWHQPILNNFEITSLMFLLGSSTLFVVSLLNQESLPIHQWTPSLLAVVIGAGAFNVMNLSLTNYGFQYVEAIFASNLLMLESAFALALGFLFYQEVPLFKEIIGGLVIIASVIAMNELERRQAK